NDPSCRSSSDAKPAPEAPGRVVGLGAVVVREHPVVAPVAEQGATQLPQFGRRVDPARGPRVELAQRLQLPVLHFAQEFDTHGGGHAGGTVLRLVLLAGLERFGVIADAAPAGGALGRAVAEDEAAILVPADEVGLPASGFHPAQ